MKKEMMYIAPEAEILVAQVERGFGDSTGVKDPDELPELPWD